MSNPETKPLWISELHDRFTRYWPFKMVTMVLFVIGFFRIYFHLLHHPHGVITIMPLTWIDRLMPLHPLAVVPYASLWVYLILGAGFVRERREIIVYAIAIAVLTIIGFGIFLFWPTATPPTHIDWTQHPGMRFLKHVDMSGNACPSLHVAFAVFTAIWFARLLRQIDAPASIHFVSALWCVAIAYSTLATKQHVAVDVIAGTALGCALGLLDPRARGADLRVPAFRLDRQVLALTVSVTAKLTLWALGSVLHNPIVAATLFCGPDLWILTGLLLPNHRGLVPTVTRFATDRHEIWLTIDDGPEPATSIPMLDLLDRHGAKATFFSIGRKVEAHPELVREVVRRGHGVGNHTQTHPLATFWLAGRQRTAWELEKCDAALRRSGSETPVWFRAPAGIKTFFLRRVLSEQGKTLVGWSARGRETFSASTRAPLRRLLRNVRPGAILVVHECDRSGHERIALLSALLDHLSAGGYRCVLPAPDCLR